MKATTKRTGDERAPEGVASPALIGTLLRLMKGDWLDSTVSVEAKRVLPALLLEVYLAQQEGRKVSKRDVSALLRVDYPTTGRKYIALAEAQGLLEVQRKDAEDKRKDFLVPTAKFYNLLRRELAGWESFAKPQRTVPIALSEGGSSAGAEVGRQAGSAHGRKVSTWSGATVVHRPSELSPYARRAAELVEAFHRSRELRGSLLESLAANLALSADFRGDGTALVATLGGPWGIVENASGREVNASGIARDLCLANSDTVKIIPGTHHFGFGDQVHPDDVQAAQAVAGLCGQLLGSSDVHPARGLFLAGDLDGTLILLGGSTSNALSRLLLQYRQLIDGVDTFGRVTEPVVDLRLVPDADREHPLLTIAEGDREPDWGIVDAVTGERFRVSSDNDGRPQTDYLLVTALPNFLTQASFDRGHRIVIFGGLHGAGTKATALLLRDTELLAGIRDSVRGALGWQALIGIDRVEYVRKRPVPVSLDRQFRCYDLTIPPDIVDRFRNARRSLRSIGDKMKHHT